MIALLSVWIGLASLAYALAIAIWRPLFSDVSVAVTLYSAILSLTFAGLSLWRYRRRTSSCWKCGQSMRGESVAVCPHCGNLLESDPGQNAAVRYQRAQAWVGTIFSVIAIACIYLLVGRAQVITPTGHAHPATRSARAVSQSSA